MVVGAEPSAGADITMTPKNHKPLPAAFGYFGGKRRLSRKLIHFIPEHHRYVEVFGGSGAMLFAKPPSPIEVFNDTQSDIVNFMRVLRDTNGLFPEFLHKISLTPYSLEEFLRCREDYKSESLSDVDRACAFFVTAKWRSAAFWTENLRLAGDMSITKKQNARYLVRTETQ